MPLLSPAFLLHALQRMAGHSAKEANMKDMREKLDINPSLQCIMAVIHIFIPIARARNLPPAWAAPIEEREKLEGKTAWLLETVREKEVVQVDAKEHKKKVHFGSLMELVHEKHRALPLGQQVYKGRVVMRGDQVKDEAGEMAVFTEQGTSASHLAAAKAFDALACRPGMARGDSDAIVAYHQVILAENVDLFDVETWTSLPPHRKPKSWGKCKDLVCKPRLNLYGHPLAGLLSEIYRAGILSKEGFQKVLGWECLHAHHEKQFFLAVHVDDYKMAGKLKT